MTSPTSSSTKYIIVDDNDPSIIYSSGGWNQGNINGYSYNFNSPYLNTIHNPNSENNVVSLQYKGGPNVRVRTHMIIPGREQTTWGCFLDGVRFGPTAQPLPQDSLVLCENVVGSNRKYGNHNLTLTAQSSQFIANSIWLDSIMYEPSDGVLYESSTLALDPDDPNLSYSADGSRVSINFIGTSLSWYADFRNLTTLPIRRSGSWTLDGGETKKFFWSLFDGESSNPGSSNSTIDPINATNQLLFTTPKIEYGNHTVVVVGLNNDISALSLSYVTIANFHGNGTSPATAVHTHTGRLGIILGTVFGVLGLLIILSACYLFLRRWKQRSRPTSTTVNPFMTSATTPLPSNQSLGNTVTTVGAGAIPSTSGIGITLPNRQVTSNKPQNVVQPRNNQKQPSSNALESPPEYSASS